MIRLAPITHVGLEERKAGKGVPHAGATTEELSASHARYLTVLAGA